ncbi:MAG: TadE/TadG family type IV pilus assembly protein [Bauldia sp.]
MVGGGIIMRLKRPLWLFRRNAQGVSAVEFALILPVMLTLYLGCNELGNGLTIARKVTHITSTLSDLVTQSKDAISAGDMTNIMNAASSIMTPYSASSLKIRISEYHIDGATPPKVHVVWSSANANDTPLPIDPHETDTTKAAKPNTYITNLPQTLLTPNTYLITAEVHYDYTPTIGYVLTGHFDLHDQFYLRPRLSNGISGPPPAS